MTRRDVIEQILEARTLEEIKNAKWARAVYLKDHPDDMAIADYGSMLSRLEEALQFIESEQVTRSA